VAKSRKNAHIGHIVLSHLFLNGYALSLIYTRRILHKTSFTMKASDFQKTGIRKSMQKTKTTSQGIVEVKPLSSFYINELTV